MITLNKSCYTFLYLVQSLSQKIKPSYFYLAGKLRIKASLTNLFVKEIILVNNAS